MKTKILVSALFILAFSAFFLNKSVNAQDLPAPLGVKGIKALINEYQDAGYKSVIWDGTNNFGSYVATGLYIYKIEAGNFVESKKMLFLK